VEDLTSIVATAHLLAAEVEPPARVWTSLRTQLEEEGIIKPTRAERGSWWQGLPDLFRARALATSLVGMLAIAAVALQIQHPAPATEARNVYDDAAMVLNADEANLAQMQLGGSVVDVSLRQNLDIVDKFIADCEQRVKEEPRDDLAREYLTGAYQQKAELLSAMMERGGSVN
jgi:hypothetical protein